MFHDSHWSQKPEEEPTLPVKRYEVIPAADAPGSWDSVEDTVFFDVMNNEDCVPSDSFTGGQKAPNTGSDFEMSRVDEKTWKGYFYRAALQDEDCFGMGVCHWDATGVSADFAVLGEKFNQDYPPLTPVSLGVQIRISRSPSPSKGPRHESMP